MIGVCFYNEEPEELRRTLVSISDQVKCLDGLVDVQVIVVSDGHRQMDVRTKKYLRRLFAQTANENEQLKALFRSMDVHAKEKADAEEDERNGVAVEQRKKAPPHLTYIVSSYV